MVSGVVKGPSAPLHHLHHLQYLAERPFLVGAPLMEPPSRFPFLGTCSPGFGAVAALAFLARAFSLYLLTKSFSIFFVHQVVLVPPRNGEV
jgi:hypothetical protein